MPAASQPGSQAALQSASVLGLNRSDGVVRSSEFLQPDPQPAPPSVPTPPTKEAYVPEVFYYLGNREGWGNNLEQWTFLVSVHPFQVIFTFSVSCYCVLCNEPLRACAVQRELISQMQAHVLCYVSLQWSTYSWIEIVVLSDYVTMATS